MADTVLYFAYGSNMEPTQMHRRCPGSSPVGVAVLPGYALTFPVHSNGDWQGGVASIEPTAGETVEGVLYRVTNADLLALDGYEAVAEGMYRRGIVEVSDAEGKLIEAVTYVANPGFNAPAPPSRRYRAALVAGATHHGLSAGYVARLASVATVD